VIEAIAKHNSRKHTVSFDTSPLAFLLIICDTVQEWNRPRLSFHTGPSEIMAWLFDPPGDRHSTGDSLHGVRMNVTRRGDRFRLRTPGKLRISLDYATPIQANCGVFNLWLDSSHNFQRLKFRGCPLDIDVEFQTPEILVGQTAIPNMYRLRDAVRETHMTFLESWFPCRDTACGTGTTNGAVSHFRIPGRPPQERLVLHLRSLASKQLITRDIDEIRRSIERWRFAMADRVFDGDYGAPEYPI
jgi:hypothetical protein